MPYLRTTQLSLSQIPPGGRSQQGGAGLLGVRRQGGAGQAWGIVEGVGLAPEPHNSVCPRFCPDLNRAEGPGVGWVGPPGAQRVGLVDLF